MICHLLYFLEEVRRLSQHLTVLRDGRSITTYATAEVSDAQVVTDMVGRSVSELYPRTRHQPGAVILEVKIPERGNLSLRRGEVIGLCGLVGAGRTEFLRAVFGLDESPGSQIRLGATTLAGNPYASWRHGAGFVSENRKEEGLASALSIGDNICLPSLAKLGRAGLISPAARDTHTIRWIDELGLHCRGPAQPIGRLSGGNQQKAAFARLLEADCDILLLDEPTRGIDIAAKAKIYEVIDRLVTDPLRPRAVVMVSSYLPELLGVCDRIAVVRRGQLGPFREIADLDSESLMREATLA